MITQVAQVTVLAVQARPARAPPELLGEAVEAVEATLLALPAVTVVTAVLDKNGMLHTAQVAVAALVERALHARRRRAVARAVQELYMAAVGRRPVMAAQTLAVREHKG